jgi:CheY-like chemotaxis protein/anti-sigma regulatory factor (Ser/Thr protein kinase)
VNLAELLEETFEIMARGAKAKGLKTRCLIEDSLSQPVLADSYRIRQIVTNLLSNAVKFTADGAVGLTARIESEADGQKQIMFEVADTGVGIPPERLADIFERFTQVDASVTRRFGGTGLGLCITQQLVQLMNGTIDVQSRPGSGSTFRCRFTFEPHAAPPALSAHGAGASVSSATGTPVATGTRSVLPLALPAGSTSSSQDSATRAPLAPLTEPLEAPPAKILIAEDSPDNQMLLKAFLKGQPHTLTFVGDGQSALEAFQSQSFDLVLMDMEMPILDGYSATRAIRAWERSNGKSTTPIIAQTAHALTERVRETLAAGCNLHITKPLSKSKLLEAIASELEKVRAQSVPH